MAIAEILNRSRVIPVLTIERAADAVPLARALLAGGLPVLEITLRTDAALAAVSAIAAALPDALPGVGTVLKTGDLAPARQAGARFAVSPGFSPALAEAAGRLADLPYLPAVATASEAMAAMSMGFRYLKFFPAEAAGGRAALKALAGPFPELRFCPTGGIDQKNAPDYLALGNVAAVGGSWVAPKEALAAGDWARITALAQAAARL